MTLAIYPYQWKSPQTSPSADDLEYSERCNTLKPRINVCFKNSFNPGFKGPGCPSCYDAEPGVIGSIPVTTEFFLLSCDSNQVPKCGSEPTIIWRSHYNISKMVF